MRFILPYLLTYLTGLLAFAGAQTLTTTNAAGQTVVEFVTTNNLGAQTTQTLLTVQTTTIQTTLQQGPVGQPDPTTATPGGPTPFVYTTIIAGVTHVIEDTFTPTNPSTTPVTPTATGTILAFSSWLSIYGPQTTASTSAAQGMAGDLSKMITIPGIILMSVLAGLMLA